MFGTLSINLPSVYERGELNVYFDGKKTSINFSKASKYKIPFSAFYAECDHEVKPITNGYKLSLVYNLVLIDKTESIHLKKNSMYVNQICGLLKSSEEEFKSKAKIYLLEHQYTAKNFSQSTLKLRDRQIVQTITEAAEEAGYYSKLCLLTHYKIGELESGSDFDDYGNYGGGNNESGDETMGEIYEEYSSLENWGEDQTPSLGYLHEEDIEIINDVNYDEEKPIEEKEEVYTGNAGMEIEYWYHYGTIVLYPLDKIDEILTGKKESVLLEWLDYILKTKKITRLISLPHSFKFYRMPLRIIIIIIISSSSNQITPLYLTS